MSKYLYVDSEGRVCRIDADTGAMIPVEWETKKEVEAKRFEQGKADLWAFGRQQAGAMNLSGLREFASFPGDGKTESIGVCGARVFRVTADGHIQYWTGSGYSEDDKP